MYMLMYICMLRYVYIISVHLQIIHKWWLVKIPLSGNGHSSRE